MKKLFTILLLLPLYLSAQKGTEYYSCCEGHNPCIQIIGEDALRAHNCCEHKIGCPAGGCGNGNINGGGGSKITPISSGIIGGLLGGLGGSLLTDANGKNQAGTYAALGYGVFSTLRLVLKPIKRSKGGSTVVGALDGAATAYAVAKLATSKNTTSPDKSDKTSLIAAAGGLVAGAVVGNLLGVTREHMGEESVKIRKKRFMSNTAFIMTENKIGIIVRL